MKITTEDVLKVAALANLELTEKEVETYRGQLDDILTYIEKLDEVDTSKIEPMAQVISPSAADQSALGTASATDTLREDVIVPCNVIEEVLRGAPDPAPPYFRVPRVIEK